MKITLAILIAALVSGCETYDAGGYGHNGYGYAQPYYYGGPSLNLSLPPVVIGNYGGYGGYRYGGGYGYRRPYYGGYRYGGGYGYRRPYYYQRPYARPYYRPYYARRW